MSIRGQSILIVEDDPNILEIIKHYLVFHGYDVWGAQSGEEARKMFLEIDPCFVILDLMLPGESGESICRWIRKDMQSNVPLIMVTAKAAEDERIRGLQMGADDYVVKPFSAKELVARVETVLRRTENRCNKITYQGITLKPNKFEVKVNTEVIDLTHHEFQLLYYLMRNPDQILSREQILNELYSTQEKFVSYRTVDVHISKIREKLGAEKGNLIETVRGVGYRFVAY
ncbi:MULTISPECIES: response regulator transcription factor [Priestia]|jgi:DNA-binding response OmpR family regulator|uniref:DNA-binding response regulator n=4 Tax=Priestia TaxID=2800373 RepID=A0A1X7FWA1_9BACI|nr:MULTISPECIES: response regulator transcription factor [Priestia]AKO91035.1 DNA-binding response regulator [Priestia filamentosa]AVD54362.1 DNA-binding response regulator [Priestia filamentosa]KAB2492414.1 response regulator transcription factor [Priestia endophytica]KYG35370.1 two-component system response regulator [Priestia endophytica]MBG9810432.1 transcriptional regulator [Priestia endophytica]